MSPAHALRRAAVLVPFLVLFLAAPLLPAGATSASVSVQDFSFTPATVTVGQGESVTWTFHSMHTTTSDQRFWDSGMRSSGSYLVTFADAGTFGYHCSMHPSMTGLVRVPLQASGAAASGWRLRWSSQTSTPADRRFDVQVRRVGSTTWTWFRKATAKRAGSFDPARKGRYVVRARTRNLGVGTSRWSPLLTVQVS
jgi:plastocyanin